MERGSGDERPEACSANARPLHFCTITVAYFRRTAVPTLHLRHSLIIENFFELLAAFFVLVELFTKWQCENAGWTTAPKPGVNADKHCKNVLSMIWGTHATES